MLGLSRSVVQMETYFRVDLLCLCYMVCLAEIHTAVAGAMSLAFRVFRTVRLPFTLKYAALHAHCNNLTHLLVTSPLSMLTIAALLLRLLAINSEWTAAGQSSEAKTWTPLTPRKAVFACY